MSPDYPIGPWLKEFRLDFLPGLEIENFTKNVNIDENCILTIRDKEEGGYYTGDLDLKLSLLQNSSCNVIDIEYRHIDEFLSYPITYKKVIFSIHNLEGEIEPERIVKMINSLPDGKNILKVAMKMNKVEKYLRLASTYAARLLLLDLNSTTNRILLSMISGTYLYCGYRENLAPNQPNYKVADILLKTTFG